MVARACYVNFVTGSFAWHLKFERRFKSRQIFIILSVCLLLLVLCYVLLVNKWIVGLIGITPKRVTSGGVHLRSFAPGQLCVKV